MKRNGCESSQVNKNKAKEKEKERDRKRKTHVNRDTTQYLPNAEAHYFYFYCIFCRVEWKRFRR